MPKRLTKITTKFGDSGKTSLARGEVVNKFDPRIEVIGDIDELNSHLGLLDAETDSENLHEIKQLIITFQNNLFDMGAELSMPSSEMISKQQINFLDKCIKHYNKYLPTLENFILPCGSRLIAQFHICRAICRRTERHLVYLNSLETVNALSLVYLNRLSDILFILARYIAKKEQVDEAIWQQKKPKISKK